MDRLQARRPQARDGKDLDDDEAHHHHRLRHHPRGHLPDAPGIIWCDGELRPPTAGPTKHLVYPIDPTWLGNGGTRWGDGAHRAGFENFTINGERGQWGGSVFIKPMPTGVTAAAASGSLASGAYAYQIAYKTSYGIGEATQPVHMWSGTGAKLTWTNTDTYAQIVVFGRAPWQRFGEKGSTNPTTMGRRVLAVLPAGTTTWTDDGSATQSGPYATTADLSAPSVVLVGADRHINGLRITEVDGTGFYSEWQLPWDGSIPGEKWFAGMESSIHDLRIEGCNGPGLVWEGPHDSHMMDITVAGTGGGAGTGTSELRNAIHLAGMGPVSITSGHVWGTHRYGFAVDTPARILGGASEGAVYAQVSLNASETFVGGGMDIFFPNGSQAKGIEVGRPGINGGDQTTKAPFQIGGVVLRQFSASSGPAVDLTNADEGYLWGFIEQSDSSGVKVQGLVPGKHDVNLINNWQGSHVVNRAIKDPRSVVLSSNPTGAAWASMPAALTELYGKTLSRTKINLSSYLQAQVTVSVGATAGVSGSGVAVQYSTDQTTWAYLDGSSGPAVSIATANAAAASGWMNIVAAARTDVWLRLVGGNGNGTVSPIIGAVTLHLQ